MAKRRLNLDNLPSNNQTTPNRQSIKPIAQGRTRHGRGSGLAGEVQNIGNSLFAEIILPAIRNAIVDFFTNGIAMMILGDAPARSGHRSNRRSYNKMYDRRVTKHRRYTEPEETMVDDILFDDRDTAKLVLGRMIQLIAEYGAATVGDLNNLVGLNSNPTYERYGWDSLQGTRIQYTREGYIIDFPEPEYFR